MRKDKTLDLNKSAAKIFSNLMTAELIKLFNAREVTSNSGKEYAAGIHLPKLVACVEGNVYNMPGTD